jgi:hypothetical protein
VILVGAASLLLSMNVVGANEAVAGSAVEPTMGSQAPAPIGSPSCSITVGRLFRYSTTVGATNRGSSMAVTGRIRLS